MQLDHINIRAADQEAMRDFLIDILGVEEGFRPPFEFPGYWLYLNGKAIIHLMQADAENASNTWIDHIAFAPFDYDTQCKRLDDFGYSYHVAGIPRAGTKQIFIQGPEGAKIELQCPDNSKE